MCRLDVNDKYRKFIGEIDLHAYADRYKDILDWVTARANLPERISKIITDYYFDELSTLKTVSRKHNVTPERIRQLLCKGVRMIGHSPRKERLICHLDSNYEALLRERKELEKSLNEVNIRIGTYHKKYFLHRHNETDISTLETSVRTACCLKTLGIRTVSDLCGYTEKELLNVRNFGKKSLLEIREILFSMGLSLKQPYIGDI
ncbi:MAG: hypothetical protein A2Y00_05420 [Omnitrophica WOR_2 bacterium GWF2_43_52]|nr:MAG: hypothetical protein A2062_02705 [Omnitrophica WOR_2 bacterium GWA2_44_7]OGX14458.1 MAG: hypothetical protein A2Y01_02165 [Omnitrophica WOR_2 bacterium GWC2_44_8]OGX20539.1 MAG: hypothetical protein A2Y00_05420 [Omnitrophica WOR_2 bacterium GWF2_43_52]HAH21645.1 hypothetical protein [Candidatus Omnitrophota bacterium]HBG64238.1 hypothetical protein [Candidatus Omnitrophota bacterium]